MFGSSAEVVMPRCRQFSESSKGNLPFTALIVLLLSYLIAGRASAAGDSYSENCEKVVPEPRALPDPNPPLGTKSFGLHDAHVEYEGNYTGGLALSPRSLTFSARRALRTQNSGVFKIEASVRLNFVRTRRSLLDNNTRRGLRLVHFRPPRIPLSSGSGWTVFRYDLNGFWDSVSGKLCMIGSGFGNLSSEHVVLKLNYLNSSNIFNSFVNGTLETLDVNGNGFDRKLISILGVNLRNYKYELIDKEITNDGFAIVEGLTDLSLRVEDLGKSLCLFLRNAGSVELKYMEDCRRVNCNFLGGLNTNYTPSVMILNEIECFGDGRVRFLLDFGDFGHFRHRLPFEPNVTLVSEGKWNAQKRRLDMVGCRIFSDSDDGFVGECLIRLSLRFPSQWTLKERSSLVGLLWSSRDSNESGYFGRVSLASSKNKNNWIAKLKYNYTETENVKSSCADKIVQNGKGDEFPDELTSDLRFDIEGGNKVVKDLWGYASPIFVENRFYQSDIMFGWDVNPRQVVNPNHTGVFNVSYLLSISTSHKFNLSSDYLNIDSFDISAEGLYDRKNGHLCMVGCMHVVGSSVVKQGPNSLLDCEILVNIQYPPIHSKNRDLAKGTIESKRQKSDRLYFEPLQIFSNSIYSGQAKESMWTMDLEITMVLISSTLSCLFVCLQLLYVRKNADVLPFISIVMLILLTLAHMVPLLLNFEALFLVKRNSVDTYFRSDGWIEVHEVLVRVITMIAFLLEFRLLQLSWCAKSSSENQRNVKTSDKKVLYITLPLYIVGGLFVWLFHLSKTSHPKPSFGFRNIGSRQKSLWGDLKTFGGLILDGFLLPQILFNILCDSKEKALTPFFYAGTSFIRLTPHAYDLYRSHRSSWSYNYIYANPRTDYYSTAWDITICIGGLLFVFLIYLQQRYGGICLLPKRYRQIFTYEKLPAANGE